ncbi:translesion error-prone DNA polymerase V autoproteolytic subunit [Chitinibacter bivalviorum]|uniref:Translesion error-prone DNA polymerase V autoproteolytic subunit n=1 Tax=Chitinibacter bivalviorum TaxID=2739434 RepID=A0A7H9BMF2_9NEIS|nr:translesion error-prone DNA polymerase V autoproteolytic subunit [Chitinibacter bivalviorum]QLG89576.1 translesion error-prone DNA polymerase V autoproteolytic subunit [Chitinibacter bivalviorum]
MTSFLQGPFPADPNPMAHYLPWIGESVPAGFPSPAADWVEDRVDLNQHLIEHPDATFYFTVSGDSMVSHLSERTIPNGATLVVDRAIQAKHNDIVVAAIDGDFTVKRLFQRGKHLALVAENPDYPPIVLGDEQELAVWGVVIAWIVRPK